MAKTKKEIQRHLFAEYVLPSSDVELKKFAQSYKMDMMEQIVSSIQYAIDHDLPFIEVFQFKNSDYVITLSEKDYLTNLEHIFSVYIEKEAYELCARVAKLQNAMKDKSENNEKKQKNSRKGIGQKSNYPTER